VGQNTIGVIYGVIVPRGVKLSADRPPWDGLLDRAEKVKKLPIPDWDGDANLLGFWVAAGASGKDGCPSLGKAVPLAKFGEFAPYLKAVERAQKRWTEFERWAQEQQDVDFPKAQLYLTETEVA
jgi:hypothetical protein